MRAWWNNRTWGEKAFLLWMTPGMLFIVVAFAMGGLRAIGVLPPAPHFEFSPHKRPVFDKHRCWWRETDARYGSEVAMEDLSDDAQFQIIHSCRQQQDDFYGMN